MLTIDQEAELVTALQGRGEIPVKFAYIGEGAQLWNAISHTEEAIYSVEAQLIQQKIDLCLASLDTRNGVNVIDIGCGNGEPAVPIIQKLLEKNVACTYVPLDISEEMLDLAAATIKKQFPAVECNPIHLDFELGLPLQ